MQGGVRSFTWGRVMEVKEFLLEIGVEEIPPGLLLDIERQLREAFIRGLNENRLKFEEVKSASTPSRFLLYGRIASKSIPQERKVQGPSKKVAFDEKGNPTKAYFGFLKAHNATEEEVRVEETPKGEYLFLIKKGKVLRAKAILRDLIPQLIPSVSLPKYMRWDDSGLKFSRPIRWLLLILGDEFIKVKLGDLISSNLTFVRKGAKYKPVKVKGISDYFARMRREGILLSFEERRAKIDSLLKAKAKSLNGSAFISSDLLLEVTNLVERPYVLSCEFKEEFLKLPEVVLLASMAKYQRVFAVKGGEGHFLNKFLAVLETRPKKLSQVKRHYEFVLNARLWDADYFFKEDTKEHLERRVEGLKGVLFHEKLGSLYEKVEVMKEVARKLRDNFKLTQGQLGDLIRAIHLCKADLLTKMVYEFPSLEGLMGGIYAEHFGEKKEICQAISEHYKPKTNEDNLPSTKLGAVLSLLDKGYNTIAILGIGEIPTGSEDPYLIRRQVQAIIRIIIQYQFDICLDELLNAFYTALSSKMEVELGRLRDLFMGICRERFQALMKGEGIPQDLTLAVLSVGFDNPAEVYYKIRSLLRVYGEKEFFFAAKVVERTFNIIRDEENLEDLGVDPELFEKPEEGQLWQAYVDNREEIKSKIEERDYAGATVLYGRAFYDIIHLFFDRVMVNVEDERIRKNRKALLYLINRLYTERVADLKETEVLKDAGK